MRASPIQTGARGPRVSDYTDYRKYLADYYRNRKQTNSSYSYRVFGQKAAVSSPSYLKMVIDGKRNLSQKTLVGFATALGLSRKEEKIFEALVHYNQSSTIELKTRYFEELLRYKSAGSLNPLSREKYAFLSSWRYVAVYVLAEIKGFRSEPDWIAARLRGKISVPQASEALRTLVQLGMLEADDSGKLHQAQGALSTDDETRALAVHHFHRDMLQLATDNLTQPSERREYAGVTFAIPRDKLPLFKEQIREFRKRINSLASSFGDSDGVYQLNLQLFPLTEDLK